MYGLKQAARLANYKLRDHLAPFGYFPNFQSPNIWKHKTRSIVFCLCVDDFGIKNFCQDDVDHLKKSLEQVFKLYIDYSGESYCGLKLRWNYEQGYVDLFMPDFVLNTLRKLLHITSKPQHAPHRWKPPSYGAKQQLTPPEDASAKLPPHETIVIKSIVGSFLYYGRAVDPTILPVLN
jgi:hypothetical protein